MRTRSFASALAVAMLCVLQPAAGIAASDDPNPHYRMAIELLEQQRRRAAIFELRNALTLNPGHHKARLLLGKLRLGAGDPEGAERHLRLAMTASYSDETEALLGRALVDQLKFEEAIRTVSRDAGTAESKQDKLLVLADAYWGLEELDEVDGIYSQMLALWPDNRDALLARLVSSWRTTGVRPPSARPTSCSSNIQTSELPGCFGPIWRSWKTRRSPPFTPSNKP